MNNSNFFANFHDSYLGIAGANPPPGSKLQPSLFCLKYIPDRADSSGIAFDMMSLEIHKYGTGKQELVKLRQVLAAMMPHLLELKESWHRLDAAFAKRDKGDPDQLGDREFGDLVFLASWLAFRCKDEFRAIIALPSDKMVAAAKAFKPISAATFETDIDVNAFVIRLIQEDQLTPEACLRAVRISPSSLKFVPPKLLTPELCLAAMEVKGYGVREALKHVPDLLRTEDLCRVAVRSSGSNIRHVPCLTKELCVLACIQDGLAWDMIPKEHRTLEVEFCASMHGFSERTPSIVYHEIEKANPEKADDIVRKYDQMFVDMHLPHAKPSELEEFGFPPECARVAERCG